MDALKRFINLIIIIALFIVGVYALFAIIEHIDKNKFNKEFNELLNQREELIIKIKNNTEEETLIEFLYKPGLPDEDQYIYYSNKDDQFIKKQIGESNVYSIELIIDDWYFVQYN